VSQADATLSGTVIARLKRVSRWWRVSVVGTVDHVAVIQKVAADSGWTPHYLFMILISAGIAVLGLLLSSPAVVIGAMLVSPLMGPIIALGFALASFDYPDMMRSLRALLFGALLAVLFTAAIVLMSPLQTVTSEIAARTRPNLFDLVVAILSALAGSYAMIRGREGAIVGVAIATALMPPLATVGFGLATLNLTVFGGSLLLFLTNFMAIALTASVMARLYGFGGALSPDKTRVQVALILVVFIALAVPLGLALRTIAWESLVARQARSAIGAQFAANARTSDISIDYSARPMTVRAVVFTPSYVVGASAKAQAELLTMIGRPVKIDLDQVRIGTGAGRAERAQIDAAEANASAQRDADALAGQLALIAGVGPEAVTVDRDHHRAVVNARPLPGATLASYHALEDRVATLQPDWSIRLVPPLLPLPAIRFGEDGAPDPQAVATIAWASRRTEVGLRLSGPAEQTDKLGKALIAAGAVAPVTEKARTLSLGWDTPPAANETP
jgi:uncharacterized hydrophobic protein (TIGR00271 family)